ncbi:putative 2-hydroxyacid dehydrogenase [Spathaspora sp. JA1]|nr:putative 2-hydroxyacid dehydrogenase [Spathaspora sp. JA1]
MSKAQVLFIGELNRDLSEFIQFQSKYECIFYTLTTREDLINKLKTDFKDIVAIYAAWLGFIPIGGFRTVIEYAPSSLKIISLCSVGYDHEDADVLAKHGIIMTNVPSDGAAEPVAELVLVNAITSFRQFHLYSELSKIQHTMKIRYQYSSGEFNVISGKPASLSDSTQNGYFFGHSINNRGCMSPRGHNVAIVGFGKIGQCIGKKLSDIGMNITYIKRTKLSLEEENELNYPVTYHAKIEDATDADLIVIACPGTPETFHLINEGVIKSMEKPFRIINIGRGTVIDEQALVDGLKSGKVLFAGLDVFEEEPLIHKELINREDVVLTPHIGSSTIENFDFTATRSLQNIDEVISVGDTCNRVN